MLHYEIGAFLGEQPVEEVITYGALAKEIARGVEGKVKTTVFEEEQKEEMTEYLEKLLREGDAVLFKGSNSMKLGETAARFI